MSAQSGSKLQVRAFFPTGSYVIIDIAFDSLETMPTADEIIAGVEAKGFSIEFDGVEAGDEIKVATHVMRRTHINKDGTTTPVIALYPEYEQLVYKIDHVYLNTPEQIADFEQVSGMKLSDIPEYDGENYLKREWHNPKVKQYVVPLVKPVKCAVYQKPYKTDSGEEKTTDKIRNFIGVSPKPVPDNITPIDNFTPETAQQFSDEWKEKGFAPADVLDILGVTRLSYWKQGIAKATERMNTALADKASA